MTRQLRYLERTTKLMVLLGLGVFGAVPALAQSNRVVLVEEHWELRLGQPDSDRSAPQTTMVMSPTGNVEGVHFLFTLNHSTVPEYTPGGMQVQLWNGGELVQDKVGDDSAVARAFGRGRPLGSAAVAR